MHISKRCLHGTRNRGSETWPTSSPRGRCTVHAASKDASPGPPGGGSEQKLSALRQSLLHEYGRQGSSAANRLGAQPTKASPAAPTHPDAHATQPFTDLPGQLQHQALSHPSVPLTTPGPNGTLAPPPDPAQSAANSRLLQQKLWSETIHHHMPTRSIDELPDTSTFAVQLPPPPASVPLPTTTYHFASPPSPATPSVRLSTPDIPYPPPRPSSSSTSSIPSAFPPTPTPQSPPTPAPRASHVATTTTTTPKDRTNGPCVGPRSTSGTAATTSPNGTASPSSPTCLHAGYDWINPRRRQLLKLRHREELVPLAKHYGLDLFKTKAEAIQQLLEREFAGFLQEREESLMQLPSKEQLVPLARSYGIDPSGFKRDLVKCIIRVEFRRLTEARRQQLESCSAGDLMGHVRGCGVDLLGDRGLLVGRILVHEARLRARFCSQIPEAGGVAEEGAAGGP